MSLTVQTAPALELPPYQAMADAELKNRIAQAKAALGDRVLVLGHHYQRDDVIAFADLTGDSLKLARSAARNTTCETIVFCGVHFMAETADILTPEHVTVILPDLTAGCSMADMAEEDQVETCWAQLSQWLDVQDLVPVTYVNSKATLKAFCGRHGGVVCTSGNARAVLTWALNRAGHVLFFPDQHLGRNTAKAMGLSLDQMVVWDPLAPDGGLDPETVRRARLILWPGFCSVHQMFTPAHVAMFRQRWPDIKILVHPECRMEVVDLADAVGSTEAIIRTVRESPPGTRWAIGTEVNLVNRLKHQHPDKDIYFLSTTVCLCTTMYRIDLAHLAWAMENLAAGCVVNPIRVPRPIARQARVALDRMLDIV